MNTFLIGATAFCKGGWLSFTCYNNGSLAIQVMDKQGPVLMATVNLPEPAQSGCVWIKDWSENEGVLAAFIAARHGKPTGRTQRSGYVVAHELVLSEPIQQHLHKYAEFI